MENKVITLRSAYKVKEYHFQPCKMANGMNYPFVKPVTYDINGNPQLLLSEAEKMILQVYFIPEDMDIVVTDGTTFNLSDPLQKNKWLQLKIHHLLYQLVMLEMRMEILESMEIGISMVWQNFG